MALIAANNLSAIGTMKGLTEDRILFEATYVSPAVIDDFPWADVFLKRRS